MNHVSFFLLLACALPGLPAATLVSEGILANSGEQGATLVRWGAEPVAYGGMGVVCDRCGTLWDRGGRGTVVRYAVDGRMLGTWKLPKDKSGGGAMERLCLVGERLIAKADGRLWSLDLSAPAGSSFSDCGITAERMSFSSWKGLVAINRNQEVLLVDPATKRETPAGTAATDIHDLELGPDGVVFVNGEKGLQPLNGIREGWPRSTSGGYAQWLDGWWWSHAWHGTVRRLDRELAPVPGVVLGGASGSFIGHLDQNTELSQGRGLALVRPGLYAISGYAGVIHLARWHADEQQLVLVRRLGALPAAAALALDRDGTVWCRHGAWAWNDAPDTPQRYGRNAPDSIVQPGMVNGNLAAPGWMWGKPQVFYGKPASEVKGADCPVLAKNLVASACVRGDKGWWLVACDAVGKAQRVPIDDEGQPRGAALACTLEAKGARWESLAANGTELFAAIDGAVVAFTRLGDAWRESKRWAAWGTTQEDRFGASLRLSVSDDLLWVSDTDRQRVLVFPCAGPAPLARFGTVDQAGDDLLHLDHPGTIAAHGDRAVVHDAFNQRLVKLALRR